ncbi:RND efflux system, inner membrane transporter CmeB [Klebsiella pneumoniae]|uniref:RND efflux system, inner membrane transporter CmeB n=1 Tax=Klebsiella pneumoniae TaxID=573 RepID=A0A2X3F542_KLEPN|nr:RND efflux system, inner membrane transporter CmeB [Klebsiella pneumoniae]
MKSKIAEFQRQMPQGYDIAYPKDSTEFIKISVEDVIQTLFEAIILVVCVMYLFLQNFRATLIPAWRCRWCCLAPSACWRCSATRLTP